MQCNARYCRCNSVRLSVRPSVRLSVCLSIRRMYCDKTKWWTANILTPHETAITLVFRHQHWLMGDAPFPVRLSNIRRKSPTSFGKRLSHAWIVTNLNGALQIFWYYTKGQSRCYSDTNSGWWATLPSLWNLRWKWPTLFQETSTSTDFCL